MEAEENRADGNTTSPLMIRLIGFVILSAASIIVLSLFGAAPLLILEVFVFAAILGVSTVMMALVLRGRTRIRW